MKNLNKTIDNIIIGSKNTVFKRDLRHRRYEVWKFCYTRNHLDEFPEKKFIDTMDGVIALFLVKEDGNSRKMILLPQRMMDKTDNDIGVLIGDQINIKDEPITKRKYCERHSNRYDIFEDAMNSVKIYNPTEAFTNFFAAANITETDFTGWFEYDGFCFGDLSPSDIKKSISIENRFLKVNVTPNYPVGWNNGQLLMRKWDTLPKRFILENPTQLDFSVNEEIRGKMTIINTESHTKLHNTGNLKKIDWKKTRLLTRTNYINDWEDPSRNPYSYFSVYRGKEDYKNRIPAEFTINRAPHLVELHLDLPENSSLNVFHASSLEIVTNTTKLKNFRCDRRLRSMFHKRELYTFLANLGSLENPLAENLEIEMGFFNYVGIWEGFLRYLPKFFEWMADEDQKHLKEKSSRHTRLLEDGFFSEGSSF